MLQCKSDHFRSSAKLVNGFALNTKEDLKEMAKIIGLSIPTKLRKDEYAAYFAESVLTFPDIWLARLTRYELTLLQKLVAAGPDTYIEEPQTFMTPSLEVLSLVITDHGYEKDGKIRYMICDELREAIAPHINNLLTSKEHENRYVIEQYLLGILNLYGLCPYQETIKLLKEYITDPQVEKEIPAFLSNSIVCRQCGFILVDECNSTPYMQSLYMFDIEDIDKELRKRPEVSETKRFTAEEVFQAGSMPYITFANSYREKLKQFMKKELGYMDETIAPALHRLWFVSQTDENAVSSIFPYINSKLSSVTKLQEAIELFSEYINHTPRWFLRGHSPAEASAILKKNNQPPRPVAGANMTTAGMDVAPSTQATFNKMPGSSLSGQQVGRNDPCPCGSGKKYKKCCGRNN